jgi:hypothetical protein
MGRGTSNQSQSADGGSVRPAKFSAEGVARTIHGALQEHAHTVQAREQTLKMLADLRESAPEMGQRIDAEVAGRLRDAQSRFDALNDSVLKLPEQPVQFAARAQAKDSRDRAKQALATSIAVRRKYAEVDVLAKELMSKLRYMLPVDPLTAMNEINALRRRFEDRWLAYARFEGFLAADQARVRAEYSQVRGEYELARHAAVAWLDEVAAGSPREIVQAITEHGAEHEEAVRKAHGAVNYTLSDIREALVAEEWQSIRDQYHRVVREADPADALQAADDLFLEGNYHHRPDYEYYSPTHAQQLLALRDVALRLSAL